MNDLQVVIPPLSPLARELLAKHAGAIRALAIGIVRNSIEMGRHLAEAKKLVGHGNWLPWLNKEFGWSEDTAENYMKVYKTLWSNSENSRNLNLPMYSLLKLAAPSTPEAARDTVLERASQGERLTPKQVKKIIDDAIKNERADVQAQLAEVRAQADQREAAVRAEYAGKLMVDPAQLDAKLGTEIEKAVAPLRAQIKKYESKLAQIQKSEQERIESERAKRKKASGATADFLTPSEADKALITIAGYLKTASLDAPAGILACLQGAMTRASTETIGTIAAATKFLAKLTGAAK